MGEMTRKLQVKNGMRIAVIDPPEGLADVFDEEFGDTRVEGLDDPHDAVLAFASSLAEARAVTQRVFATAGEGCLVWIAYPKKSSGVKTDINRDSLWESLSETGWRPVRQVSIDDTWSAIRLRPEGEVGR